MNKINVLLIFNSKLNQLIKISDEAFIPVVTNIIGENYPGYFKNTNRINIEEVNYDLFVLPSSDIKKTDLKNFSQNSFNDFPVLQFICSFLFTAEAYF